MRKTASFPTDVVEYGGNGAQTAFADRHVPITSSCYIMQDVKEKSEYRNGGGQ